MSTATVNPALTPNRPNRSRPTHHTRARRKLVENDDYAAFTQRVIAAHGRRIAQGDIEGLTTLAGLAEDINTALTEAITGLRAAGFSWADIATRLDISRQAAQQRWGGDQP